MQLRVDQVTPAFLEKAGVALHGENWKAPLARDLGVSLRALRRWAAGENAVPDDCWPKLRALLIQHSLDCRDLAATLPKANAQARDGLPHDFGARHDFRAAKPT